MQWHLPERSGWNLGGGGRGTGSRSANCRSTNGPGPPSRPPAQNHGEGAHTAVLTPPSCSPGYCCALRQSPGPSLHCHTSPLLITSQASAKCLGRQQRRSWGRSGNPRCRVPYREPQSGPPGAPMQGRRGRAAASAARRAQRMTSSTAANCRPKATPLHLQPLRFPGPCFLLFSKVVPESRRS